MSVTSGPPTGPTIEEKRAQLARLLAEKARAKGVGATRPAARAADEGAHRLVEAQAARTPAALAVGDLTYADLDARANRLAHHLRGLGVGPETLVGLAVGRSPAMVVGLLGVLKAGGAYVPIDPAFPPGRIALMLDDARPKVVVTESGVAETLPEAPGAAVVRLDDPALDARPATPPEVAVRGDDLAYVIYTSGSTGRPKGVMVTHGALANFLQSLKDLLGVKPDDILMAVTTLSFDIAALELLLPLTVGARVDVVPREVASDGPALAARLGDGGATILQATPATWRMLLESGWRGTPGLAILCGGEALPRALADRLVDKGRAVWNLYGPTETTIWSSLARVEPGEGPVPIGKPIAQTPMYVLDSRLRPVPVGVTGELHIGGAGVARGYLGRPGLTADRFLPDPFRKTPGARVYRTGDLARWRADGALECLGRADSQVKVRGFRIELGEVESALAGHESVREAAVVARDDGSGENALIAYGSPRDGRTIDPAELRRFLADRLPEYMVPSRFVALDALPLTPNGKVDRNALPDPDPSRGPDPGDYAPPRGPIEEAIAGIWGEILRRDRVGIHDNFFELGGHSLFAAQLVARLRDTFAVEPTLRDFLEAPTVAGLARVVERAMAIGAGLQAPPIGRADRSGPIPASFAQRRLWFLDQLSPGDASYNIPTAVRLAGDLDVPALGRALDEVVRRHEVLRTTFVDDGGVPLQSIGPAGPVPLPVVDLSGWPEATREAEAARVVAEGAARPFDLARGPLVRAGLIRLSDREHIIGVTMHHVASDGWSIGVLVREVSALYEASRAGRPSPLDEPTIQYADYAAWQRDWLRGHALDTQLDFWRGELAGVATLDLPTDRPRANGPVRPGGERSALLPRSALAEVQALGRREGSTLFMTLLAAFQVLLHRYSGQADIAVGSPIAGRTRSELEGLIGFFVNTLVLRGDLSGDPSFREHLARVRRRALGAYAHQDLPFEQLVGVLHPDRESGRSPLFQVMFVLQNAPLPALRSPELEMTPLPALSGSAKYDLTLAAGEEEDGLRFRLEYDAGLFEAETVDRMLGHLVALIESAVADPGMAVSALPMLSSDERRRLVGQWNGSAGLGHDHDHDEADDHGFDDLFGEDRADG